MGIFIFKSEYVIAMFNKISRFMSRILCVVGPEGQSSILLVGKVKKIKALGLMPMITLIFMKKMSIFWISPPPLGKSPNFVDLMPLTKYPAMAMLL